MYILVSHFYYKAQMHDLKYLPSCNGVIDKVTRVFELVFILEPSPLSDS